MEIHQLYDFLADKDFQNPKTGNLFFPAYIYTYEAKNEYEVQEEIKKLVAKLKRPNNYLDCLVLNIYEEMIEYLKNHFFAGQSLWEQIQEKEEEDAEEAEEWFQEEIDGQDFIQFIEKKVKEHFQDRDDNTRVYLLVHGFGNAYPQLRASDFLKRTESLIKDFKLIIFYPGEYINKQYRLFGELKHDNMYRATLLNQLSA